MYRVFLLFCCVVSLGIAGCTRASEPAAAADASVPAKVKIIDISPGRGTPAAAGDTLTVHYIGKLQDGTKFDSSYDHNEPIQFVLGQGQVIAGWDQGLVGMKVGGKRQLIIPPDLGYGSQGSGPIPGNSTLYFDVELLAIHGS